MLALLHHKQCSAVLQALHLLDAPQFGMLQQMMLGYIQKLLIQLSALPMEQYTQLLLLLPMGLIAQGLYRLLAFISP
jgi:hypothetical protein